MRGFTIRMNISSEKRDIISTPGIFLGIPAQEGYCRGRQSEIHYRTTDQRNMFDRARERGMPSPHFNHQPVRDLFAGVALV